MEITKFTLDQVKDAGVALVAEVGEDFVYKEVQDVTCVYVENGSPSCAVGRILHSLGVPVEVLSDMDSGVTGYPTIFAGDETFRASGFDVDDLAGEYLGFFQLNQDNRLSYGAAHRAALAEVEGDE